MIKAAHCDCSSSHASGRKLVRYCCISQKVVSEKNRQDSDGVRQIVQ